MCNQYFSQTSSFAQIPLQGRQGIAGTLPPDTDRWFGWMGAAGRFMALVNQQPSALALWIDAIPVTGPVTCAQIEKYMIGMLGIDGISIATATRLLAMKRPDYCLPITSTNYDKLKSSVLGPFCPPRSLKNKGFPEISRVAQLYVALLAKIWSTPWWQAPTPATAGWPHTLWQGRVAMLDAIFYDP
ncbi:MAG: hypothetical protein OWS74_02525 [Firmicutes bacterium]|nr:hypothetical protein [Bacillota bacterium]